MTTPQSGSSLGSGASRRTRRVLGLLVLAVLVAAGLAVIDDQRDPAEFRERIALPSCGTTETEGDGTVPPAASACLDAALRAMRGAELRVSTYTVEGDEIRAYYRALPGRGVEVFLDNTRDAYGSGAWARQDCPDAERLQQLGRCTTATL